MMYVVATDNSVISEIKPSRRIFTAPGGGQTTGPWGAALSGGYHLLKKVF